MKERSNIYLWNLLTSKKAFPLGKVAETSTRKKKKTKMRFKGSEERLFRTAFENVTQDPSFKVSCTAGLISNVLRFLSLEQ